MFLSYTQQIHNNFEVAYLKNRINKGLSRCNNYLLEFWIAVLALLRSLPQTA